MNIDDSNLRMLARQHDIVARTMQINEIFLNVLEDATLPPNIRLIFESFYENNQDVLLLIRYLNERDEISQQYKELLDKLITIFS